MRFSHRGEFLFLRQKAWSRALAALFDLFSIYLAWHATVLLRLVLNPVMSRRLSETELTHHAPPAPIVLLLWAGVALWLRLYGRRQNARAGGRLRRVLNAIAVLSAVLIVYTFFSRQVGADDPSRSFVLLFAPMSLALLMAANYAVLTASVWIGRRFRFEERVAVAGEGPEADYVAERLSSWGGSARVVGFIVPSSGGGLLPASAGPVLGTTATLAEVINRARLDRIIVANGSLPVEEANTCTRIARRMGVVTAHALAGVIDADEDALLRVGNGLAMVELRPQPFGQRQEMVKRIFDAAISAILLSLLLPLLLVLAILVKLTSPGPVFYVSDRVGRAGRHFRFYKFRTMFPGADALRARAGVNELDGHLFKIKDDPRVTALGRFMRRFSLDELPQLVNVLIGNMSLVGPRPLPAGDLDPDGRSRRFAAWAQERAEAMPGITCLWQIRGRSDLPFERMIELDLEYIRNWSLGLELEILLETPLAVLSGRGAY